MGELCLTYLYVAIRPCAGTRNHSGSGSRGIRTHDSRIKSPVRYLAAP